MLILWAFYLMVRTLGALLIIVGCTCVFAAIFDFRWDGFITGIILLALGVPIGIYAVKRMPDPPPK